MHHRLHRLADGDRRQRLDEPSRRAFACVGGKAVDVAPAGRRCSATATCGTSSCTCTSPATSSPASCSPAPTRSGGCAGAPAAHSLPAHGARDPADDRRAGLAGPGAWSATGPARDVASHAAGQARGDRGARADDQAGRPSICSAGTPKARSSSAIAIPKLLSLLAFHNPERHRPGPRRGPRRSAARRSTSCASPSRRWSGSARCWRCWASSICSCACGAVACPSRCGSTARWSLAGPPSVVALIAGWVMTEVGRQPWVVYRVMLTSQAVTGARRHPDRLRARSRSVYLAVAARRRVDPAAPRA